ncbi:hypothetical protein CBR_g8865 [Chara braunii]|nr:hypothetical protein CBR_g8865 [Chara braunii]|eukprot:GBG71447.1 hypothetical protein CBR_g8865 [Chara braunii]
MVGLRHATPQSSTSVVGLRQTTIEDNAVMITAHEQTQRTVDDWMTVEYIPFNMMWSEYWDRMVHALMNTPKGFRYAEFENTRTKRVEVTRGRVAKRVEELRQEWLTTDCMLQLDGWTDRRQRPHINVMVSFPKGSIFSRSVCMSRCNKGASAYYGILKRAIEEIGAEAVVGVVMDNAVIYIEKVMQTSKHLLKLLKLVDGTGPTIINVYARMDNAVEKLRESTHFTEAEKDELEVIIMRRWNTMTSPLHCATLFLDLKYRASRPDIDAEIVDGFWTRLYSWCKEAAYMEVDAEVCSWIEGIGKHTTENARTQARTMQPARWWQKWCSDMPILQKQVVRLLGQASPSGCERNWSLFERIHSHLLNNLGAIKLSMLVFNRWNQHLLDFLTKKPKADDSTKWEADEPVEDLTRDDMASDARLRLGEWRARLRGTHSVHDEGENDDSGSDEEDIPVQAQQTAVAEEVTVQHRDEEVEDVEGVHLEGGPTPARATRKRGRQRKAPVEEEEVGTRRGTRKQGRLQMQPVEEEEAALEKTSSADKHGSSDGSSSSDERGAEHDENDGSGRSGGARDGSGSSDESEDGRGSSNGGEKDGRSSEEEDDSECEGGKEDGSSSKAENDSELQHSQTSH